MSLTNCPKHTNQHGAIHHRTNRETKNDRYQDPAIFNYNRHGQAVEHERGSQVCVKVGRYVVCDESVDEVADEFIKLKHKKFESSNSMSTKADEEADEFIKLKHKKFESSRSMFTTADEVADEFIKLQHKKFESSKSMSTKSG